MLVEDKKIEEREPKMCNEAWNHPNEESQREHEAINKDFWEYNFC